MQNMGHIIFQVLFHICFFIYVRTYLFRFLERGIRILVHTGAAHFIYYYFSVNRFHDVITGAHRKCVCCHIFASCGCNHNKRRHLVRRNVLFDPFHDGDSIHSWHNYIQKHNIRIRFHDHGIGIFPIVSLSDYMKSPFSLYNILQQT